LLLTERKHLLEAFHQGMLSQRTYEMLLEDVDARLLRLETENGKEE
jgi:predicted transcriptional regulator